MTFNFFTNLLREGPTANNVSQHRKESRLVIVTYSNVSQTETFTQIATLVVKMSKYLDLIGK